MLLIYILNVLFVIPSNSVLYLCSLSFFFDFPWKASSMCPFMKSNPYMQVFSTEIKESEEITWSNSCHQRGKSIFLSISRFIWEIMVNVYIVETWEHYSFVHFLLTGLLVHAALVADFLWLCMDTCLIVMIGAALENCLFLSWPNYAKPWNHVNVSQSWAYLQ